METNKTKNTDLFLIDPRNIVVVDGFNVRRGATRNTNWWMVNAGIGLPCWLYPRVRIFLMFVP